MYFCTSSHEQMSQNKSIQKKINILLTDQFSFPLTHIESTTIANEVKIQINSRTQSVTPPLPPPPFTSMNIHINKCGVHPKLCTPLPVSVPLMPTDDNEQLSCMS